ncbi:hypothetical protein OHW45_04565 [Acinetobacter baumannii]|uniref:hypothetical protein n=1 Tax=Acinetobacter calcoaceticus/baumannii complex TaxID=909768 RepID=UPI00190181D6|nr:MULTISPECIES: hypothetical protein [Acinetobacter calcoaceticus/baumannii complex]MBJ8506730.1 hypothetical protein [Acinetobacter seifertii]MDC5157254.1 hypothetical protein [Acinetobacter baumannii]
MRKKLKTKTLIIALSLSFIGCSNSNSDLKIDSADIVIKDDLPQLEICFNKEIGLDKNFISDIRVRTKDGQTFGRSDMYVGSNSQNTEGNCIFEPPYIFLRNSSDQALRAKFEKSMKPDNIAEIEIKLGTQAVKSNYSDDFKLTEFKKIF